MGKSVRKKAMLFLGMGALVTSLAACGVDGHGGKNAVDVKREGMLVSMYDGVTLGDSIDEVKKSFGNAPKGAEAMTRKSEFTELKATDGSSVYVRYDGDGKVVEKSLLYSDKMKHSRGLLKSIQDKNDKEFGTYDAFYKVKYNEPTIVDNKASNSDKKVAKKEEKGSVYNVRMEWRKTDRLISAYTSQMGSDTRVFEGEMSMETGTVTKKDKKQ